MKYWNINITSLLLAGLWLLLPGTSTAQEFLDDIPRLKAEYQGESIIQPHRKIHYILELKDGKVEVTRNISENYYYVKNVGVFRSSRYAYGSDMIEFVDYEANAYIPSGNKFKKIKVKEHKASTDTRVSSFTDDIVEYKFDYPGLTEGAVIELNTVHKINDPRYLGTIFMRASNPVDELEITVEIENGIELKYIEKHFEGFDFDYSSTENRNTKLYTWKSQRVKKRENIEFSPDERYYEPHIILMIPHYTVDKQQINLSKDIKELHKWYYKLTSGLEDDIDDDAIKKLSLELVKDAATDEEKTSIIYHWVQSNIKYIDFEEGMGAWVPRKPDEIFHRRFGDCKDKSSLLRNMLKHAGIISYLTWIGTVDIPYTYDEFPLPITDNHMIITVYRDNKAVFLDATSERLPYGVPASNIQGKQALVSMGRDEFRVEEVPVLDASGSTDADLLDLEISGKSIKGKGLYTATGYIRNFLQADILSEDPGDIKKMLDNYLEKGSNKFILNEYKFGNLESFTEDLTIDYDFTLEGYIYRNDNEILINLNMTKDVLQYKLKKDRRIPIRFNYCHENTYVNKLTIPEGYVVDYLPENTSYSDPGFEFSTSYRVEGSSLIYEHKVSVKSLMVDVDVIPAWNEFIKKMERSYKETIILKKNE